MLLKKTILGAVIAVGALAGVARRGRDPSLRLPLFTK